MRMTGNFTAKFNKIKLEYSNGAYIREFEQLKAHLLGKTVVLFGAAWIGDFFYHKLSKAGIPIECFADNFAVGVSPAGHGPIIKPSELAAKFPDAMVIISCDKARDIVFSQLLELGYSPEQIIKYPRQLLAIMDMGEFEKYREGYERAYNFFTDDVSKQIIIERIRCYLFGENMNKSNCPQYFEQGIVTLSDNEIFVDGGFFTGDTTEEFIAQTDGMFKYIYAFEPDKFVLEKVRRDIRNSAKISIIMKGLHSKVAELRFATTGGASQASGGNIVTDDAENVSIIPVTSLDAFFEDKPLNEYPTYIKLDIEGAEREALLGMRNIISIAHPKLAICAYHKPEDIYDLYELIREFRRDYKFHLRHYANYFWETVLYAI
jgi:FkbM family methyltransferase